MERLGTGTNFGDHYHDNHDDGDVEQTHDQKEDSVETVDTYKPLYDQDPDSPAWEDHPRERLQDAADRQAEDKVEGQGAYVAARVGYRYRARLDRQGGGWSPLDTSSYVAPVFVRVSDLQQRWDWRPDIDQA